MGPKGRSKRKPAKEEVSRSLESLDDLPAPPAPKQPKIVPSITKGVSVPSKPRVGGEFQAVLPAPAAPAPAAAPPAP